TLVEFPISSINDKIMADFPEETIIRRIRALMGTSGLAKSHSRVLESMRATYVSKYIAQFIVASPGAPIPNNICAVALAKDLALLPEIPPQTTMPSSAEETNTLHDREPADIGQTIGWGGRETPFHDKAHSHVVDDIGLAAREVERVALEHLRPPSLFLHGQDPASIQARDALRKTPTSHQPPQTNQKGRQPYAGKVKG
ncbi:hypothetical protein KEM48_005182, partial [Puccinia striiformis f. sp. tritici PST-130]